MQPRHLNNIQFTPSLDMCRPPSGQDMYLALLEDKTYGIVGAWSYNQTKFSEKFILQLLGDFRNILVNGLNNYKATIGDIISK